MDNYLLVSNLLQIINANKELFLETIAPNPKNLEYLISVDAPQIVCEVHDEKYSKVPIKKISADLEVNSSYKVLFVEFSESFVKKDADAYAIAIAISPDNDIRLFDYEKGGAYISNQPKYFVGEFTLDNKYINHGSTSKKDMSLFSGMVIGVLKNRRYR